MANLRNSKNFEDHHFPRNLASISSIGSTSQNYGKIIRRAIYFYRGTMILKMKYIFEKKNQIISKIEFKIFGSKISFEDVYYLQFFLFICVAGIPLRLLRRRFSENRAPGFRVPALWKIPSRFLHQSFTGGVGSALNSCSGKSTRGSHIS